MTRKVTSTPKAVPKNNPGGKMGKVKGSVPTMQNPPKPPPKKK
jgi:hypothetical protein